MTDYTFSTGDTSWAVPAGVTSLAVADCLSGGSSGGTPTGHSDPEDGTFLTDRNGAGGPGGYFARDVNIPVTPGEILSIRVGIGGTLPGINIFDLPSYATITSGGASWIKRGSTALVLAGGGTVGTTTHNGGAATGGGLSGPGLGGSAASASADGIAGAAAGATGDGGGEGQNGRNGAVTISAVPGGGGGGATGPAIAAVVML